MSYLLNCVNCYLERWIGLQYGGGRPASFYFILFIFKKKLAKMASNWGCALSSNAPYSRINTVLSCNFTNFCFLLDAFNSNNHIVKSILFAGP